MAHLNNKSTTSYFFSFHPGTSLVHQVPAAIKLLVVPVLSLAVFLLPPTFSICLLVIQFLLALYAKISIQEQIKDLKPVFLYLILLELFQLINGINQMTAILNEFYSASSQSLSAQHLEQITAEKMTEALQTPQPQPLTMTSLFHQVFCSKEFIQTQKNLLFMFSRLFALLQASSLLYKTTSSLQIRSGIAFLEKKNYPHHNNPLYRQPFYVRKFYPHDFPHLPRLAKSLACPGRQEKPEDVCNDFPRTLFCWNEESLVTDPRPSDKKLKLLSGWHQLTACLNACTSANKKYLPPT